MTNTPTNYAAPAAAYKPAHGGYPGFTLDHRPAADGAVWTVLSPEGTSVWRDSDFDSARAEADRRNAGSEVLA